MSLRILFLGENWYGSCARACCYSLRRLGHHVWDVDSHSYLPRLRRPSSRVIRRILEHRLVAEYNEAVLQVAATFRPDFLLAFKGTYVKASILRYLRGQDIATYNYYPDTSAFAHGRRLPMALPEYDCVFYTKRFWKADVSTRLKLKAAKFVRHGYDPEIHRPWELDGRDHREFGHDVVVIATHTPQKEAFLRELLRLGGRMDLCIWGNGWSGRCKSPSLKWAIQGAALEGTSYSKAIRAGRINLALLSGPVRGSSQGDETTTRTFEIPASGGFMLHERTREVLELYDENREIACFDSPREAVDKISHFLGNHTEREAVARAGHERCVPAYSYDNRMTEIIEWHQARIAS